MLSYDNLKAIFERGKKPYWVLYQGASKGKQIGTNCVATEEKPSLTDAWDDLDSILLSYGDGVYTLECRSHPQTSRGNDQHTFMVGNVEEKAAGRSAAVAGFQNPAIGFFQGLDAKYFMDQVSGANTSLQALQIDLLRKEMEVQNLKRELKEKKERVTPMDRVFGILEQNPSIIDKVLSGNATAAVGLLKAEKSIPETHENDAERDDPEEYAYEAGKLDFNAIVDAAMRIQKALPHMHVNDVFDGLADWVEDNPSQADQYLKMMMK